MALGLIDSVDNLPGITSAIDRKNVSGGFAFTYDYLAQQNWKRFLLITFLGLFIGYLIYLFVSFFFKKDKPVFVVCSLVVGCLLTWFFLGGSFEVNLSLYVGGAIFLTVTLLFFILLIYDLVGRGNNSNQADLPPDDDVWPGL